MPQEPNSRRGWIIATDKDFSLAIRAEAADAHGVCVCVTCGRREPWRSGRMHAGHWLSKASHSVRYSEINVHPQCSICNCTGHAYAAAYARRKIEDVATAYHDYMIHTYGQKAIDALRLLQTTSRTWQPDELRVMRAWYKWRFQRALEAKGL